MSETIPRRRPRSLSGVAVVHDLECVLLGAILYGTAKDAKNVIRCGFDPAGLRGRVHRTAWPVIEWALGLGLPAAAIPVLQAQQAGLWEVYERARPATKWDVGSWRKMAPTVPQETADDLTLGARRRMRTIERSLNGSHA